MDEILRYISEIEDKDLLSDVIYAIRDDIPDVLRINSSRLLPFLEKIYERGGKESIFFANPKSDLPINKFSSVKRLYFQDFVIEEETDQKQLLVQHWASPLSWNYTNGSSHSL